MSGYCNRGQQVTVAQLWTSSSLPFPELKVRLQLSSPTDIQVAQWKDPPNGA